MTSTSSLFPHGTVVWIAKPWVTPTAVIRTVVIVVLAIFFLFLEMYAGVAFVTFASLNVFLWTLFAFSMIWVVSMLALLVFWASNSYMLRQDGLEIRCGIIRLHSFVVTPSAFGDLMLYQSVGGRIFGYGDLTVNSQGERETKMALVRSPSEAADTIRDVMGKPIVRLENRL